MGSFIGHAAPGSFFIIVGLWWAFSCLRRHLVCKRDGVQFISTAIFGQAVFPKQTGHSASSDPSMHPWTCKSFLARLPLEGVIKILFSLTGITMEIGKHLPPPIPARIVQHSTMYFFFLLAGLVDCTIYLGIHLPDGSQHVIMALALCVEGLLFASHVHGREILDVHLHLLLVWVIAITVIVFLLEAKYRKSAILTMGRSFLLMLQGTWFWGIAVILYKHGVGHSDWDLTSPESVMLATIYFSWHCGAIFIFLILMNILMAVYYRQRNGQKTSQVATGTMVSLAALINNSDGVSKNSLAFLEDDYDDEEEEDEDEANAVDKLVP